MNGVPVPSERDNIELIEQKVVQSGFGGERGRRVGAEKSLGLEFRAS